MILIRDATVDTEVLHLNELEDLCGKWSQILNEMEIVDERLKVEIHFLSKWKVNKICYCGSRENSRKFMQ